MPFHFIDDNVVWKSKKSIFHGISSDWNDRLIKMLHLNCCCCGRCLFEWNKSFPVYIKYTALKASGRFNAHKSKCRHTVPLSWLNWSQRCFIQIRSIQQYSREKQNNLFQENKKKKRKTMKIAYSCQHRVFDRVLFHIEIGYGCCCSGRCWLIYYIILKHVCYALEIRYCQFFL